MTIRKKIILVAIGCIGIYVAGDFVHGAYAQIIASKADMDRWDPVVAGINKTDRSQPLAYQYKDMNGKILFELPWSASDYMPIVWQGDDYIVAYYDNNYREGRMPDQKRHHFAFYNIKTGKMVKTILEPKIEGSPVRNTDMYWRSGIGIYQDSFYISVVASGKEYQSAILKFDINKNEWSVLKTTSGCAQSKVYVERDILHWVNYNTNFIFGTVYSWRCHAHSIKLSENDESGSNLIDYIKAYFELKANQAVQFKEDNAQRSAVNNATDTQICDELLGSQCASGGDSVKSIRGTDRIGCYSNVAVNTNNIEVCEKLRMCAPSNSKVDSWGNAADTCYRSILTHYESPLSTDVSICPKIQYEHFRNLCYSGIAARTGQSDLCEKIENDNEVKDECRRVAESKTSY